MKGHDRYLIYKLLGKSVSVRMPHRMGGGIMSGVVNRVCRDIFEDSIDVTLDDQRHNFEEPEAIIRRKNSILFLYGDVDWEEMCDDEIFDEAMSHAYDESFTEFLDNSGRRPVVKVEFRIGEQEKTPGERWRSRDALM